jgi:hypothetical protein
VIIFGVVVRVKNVGHVWDLCYIIIFIFLIFSSIFWVCFYFFNKIY